jgi:hypothetical protein
MRSMIPKREEQILREHAVDLVHHFLRLSIHTKGHVIQRRPADLQQFALAGQAQIRVIPIDHRFAFVRAHRFSPCDKKSFSTASLPIFA